MLGVEFDNVKALGRQLPVGHVDSLEHLSTEQAAVALVDLFLRTGSAQAHVTDTESVRKLVRRERRRRGAKVRTFATHNIIVVYDDARRDAFLETEEGQAYADAMTQRMFHAFDDLVPDPTPRLRAVPPPDAHH